MIIKAIVYIFHFNKLNTNKASQQNSLQCFYAHWIAEQEGKSHNLAKKCATSSKYEEETHFSQNFVVLLSDEALQIF